MTTQDFYNEIYGKMSYSKEKGYKIILKKNLQSTLFVNINSRGIFNNNLEGDFVYRTKLSVDNLIENILLREGNRAKIKLRNYFGRNNKVLWGEYLRF